jgi:hypothetical protein
MSVVGDDLQKICAATEIPSPSTVAASPTSPKPNVRFSDRRTFSKRPAGVPRNISSHELPAEWGILFDINGHATHRLGSVLRGLAKHIVSGT